MKNEIAVSRGGTACRISVCLLGYNTELALGHDRPTDRRKVMKANVGSKDRVFRIVLGLAIIGIGIINKSWWGAIGILPLATAVIRWCPAYIPFGISTCRMKSE